MTIANLDRVSRFGFLDARGRARVAAEQTAKLRIKADRQRNWPGASAAAISRRW